MFFFILVLQIIRLSLSLSTLCLSLSLSLPRLSLPLELFFFSLSGEQPGDHGSQQLEPFFRSPLDRRGVLLRGPLLLGDRRRGDARSRGGLGLGRGHAAHDEARDAAAVVGI